MRRETEQQHKYIILLFHIRQARGTYLIDIPFINLVPAEQDKLRREGKKWLAEELARLKTQRSSVNRWG